MGVAGYNGTFTITAMPTPRTFQYTRDRSGLANSGGGTATFFSPFQVRIGGERLGRDRRRRPAVHEREPHRDQRDPGFAGTATVTGAASTGLHGHLHRRLGGIDVPNIELVNLSCGGCFASVEETNHGGTNDSFKLNYNGNVSAPITNGTNYTAAGILAALTPILPAGATVTVAGFGGGTFNNTGFQVTFTGGLAATNVPVTLAAQNFTAGASGFVGETDKGGAVDNKGGIDHADRQRDPGRHRAGASTRSRCGRRSPSPAARPTPTATRSSTAGSRTTAARAAGTSLLNNTKTNGPLFAMFPKSGQISDSDSLHVQLAGREPPDHRPDARVPGPAADPGQQHERRHRRVPDRADRPAGAAGRQGVLRGVPARRRTTSASRASNASPLSLHFRLTARDGRGGVNSADTTLLLAPAPARSSSPRRTRR